ncbi:hypothetical protein NC796_14860 [Aliifodinibius sp. S!AR15-10]|nr:hypothetical protein [Aliifodinibius sp. S!AR15-10]MDR8392432.1 hypothetical protein [Aliifodinibius sp. S!AR15-10]
MAEEVGHSVSKIAGNGMQSVSLGSRRERRYQVRGTDRILSGTSEYPEM